MIVTLPPELADVNPDAKSGTSGYLRVENEGGSDIDFDINTDVNPDGNNMVTITIDQMDIGQGVEIIYYSVMLPEGVEYGEYDD